MFSLRSTNAKQLKKIFDSINGLFESSLLECTAEGICLRTFDSAHICIINLELDASGFDQYTCVRDTVFGIHLNSFCLILSQGTSSSDIVCISSVNDNEMLEFAFQDSKTLSSTSTTTIISRYFIKLLEINQECFTLTTDDNYECKIIMPSRELAQICKNLNQLGKNIDVEISVNEREAIFSAVGDELISSKVIVKPPVANDDDDYFFFVNDGDDTPTSGGSFSLGYLVSFLRAAGMCQNVSLFIKRDVIKIYFEISKDERLTFYLPGKIKDCDF